MIIDEPTDEILPCECGFKPTSYAIAYGPTPYSIFCKGCRKSLHGGTGSSSHFFGYWNKYVRQVKSPNTMYGIHYSEWYMPLVFKTRFMGLHLCEKPLNPVRDKYGRFAILEGVRYERC